MIIGLIGYKQSGKDEIAKILMKHYNFKKYAFADPIKEICKIIFMWDDERLNNPSLKEKIDLEWNISPRQAFQTLGTELFQYDIGEHLPLFKKKIGKSIWAERFKKWYEQHIEIKNIVISDIRFFHEYEILNKLNTKFIRVYREVKNKDFHISEIELEQIPFDYEIDNNRSLKDLEKTVIDLMENKVCVRN